MRGCCALTTELRNSAQRVKYIAGVTLESSPKRFRKAFVFVVIIVLLFRLNIVNFFKPAECSQDPERRRRVPIGRLAQAGSVPEHK
jgi:hypothetical protein